MRLQRLFAILMDAAQPGKSIQLTSDDIKQLANMQCPHSGDTLLHLALRKLNKFTSRAADPHAAAQLDWCVALVQQLLENSSNNVFLENRKNETVYDLMRKNSVQWTFNNGIAQVSDDPQDLPKYFYDDTRFPHIKIMLSEITDDANKVAKGQIVHHGEKDLPEFVLSPRYVTAGLPVGLQGLSVLQMADKNGHHDFYRKQLLAHAYITLYGAENKQELQKMMGTQPEDISFYTHFADSAHTITDCAYLFSVKKQRIREILNKFKKHTMDEIAVVMTSLEELVQAETLSRRIISFPETLQPKELNELINPKTLQLIATAASKFCLGDSSSYRWDRQGSGAKKSTYNVNELSQSQITALNDLATHVGMPANYFNQHTEIKRVAAKISTDLIAQPAIGLDENEIFPNIEVLVPGNDQPVLLSSVFNAENYTAFGLFFQPGAGHPGQWTNRDNDLANWKLITHPDAPNTAIGCAAGCTGQLDNHILMHPTYKKDKLQQIIIMSNKTSEQLLAIKNAKNPDFIVCGLTPKSREQLQELGYLSMNFQNEEYLYRNTFIVNEKRIVNFHLDRSQDGPALNAKEAERTLTELSTRQELQKVSGQMNKFTLSS